MKKTVEIEKFDLMRFAEKTLDYCKTILDPEMEPTSGIGSAEDYSSIPEFSDRKERDLRRDSGRKPNALLPIHHGGN